MSRFELLETDRPASKLEEELLAQWRSERLFEQSLAARAGSPTWVFYDGPPTANGRPGVHHVFARTMKDLFCRYRAMRGYYVARKAGWDTHGLPVEIEVEKELGISGKPEIEALGVENFNRRCRESVWKYRAEWEQMVERIAHWMDYERPYVTYTNDYIESEWWALKTLHERGLLYRGHKILPYCARCGTSLSSHEVAQGYEDVEDPSVYVALNLVPEEGEGSKSGRRRLVVWTTTPWTLVSNVALAVHPDLTYVELRKRNAASDSWTIILAEARAGAVLGEDYTDRWETVKSLTGSELVGHRYERPLDWVPFPADAGEHELIVPGDFVSAEDGSGIVHMAPAFGADDYAMGKKHGLAMLQPVTNRGTFGDEIPVVGGLWVKDADAKILEELKKRDVLWKAGTLMHSYPHCWRCKTPLLYMARVSWFIRTSSYKDDMLARNARMAWYPVEVGEGRFGEWLKNNVDWAISRDRFWGTPLPVWVCERDETHVVVVGSYAELAERAQVSLPDEFDPHKPFVDGYRWPCPRCQGVTPAPNMARVSEVIDAWFDSGSMPFAQWHYPFENHDVVAEQYPADFIAEGLDQTRGWFYSLLAIAAGLGDALPNNESPKTRTGKVAPYSAVVVNDLVLDATGVKMSKSRGNVVNPWDVIDEFGADAVRLFLVASSQLGTPKLFDPAAIRDSAARFLLTLKNVYSGIFAQYANFGWSPSSLDPQPNDRPLIDRWVLSRAASVEKEVDERLANFDATAAARLIMSFVVDDVSNWYVRLNRSRFFDIDGADNRAAFATLHTVLTVTTRLLAPIAPFLSDWMHRQLQGTSVHLADIVRSEREEILPTIEAAMEEVRHLSRLGRAAREEAGINVRRPLSRVLCVVPPEHVEGVQALLSLLKSELNVKEVALLTSADDLVMLEAKPNFRALGKKFGKSTPRAANAVEALASDHLRAFERGDQLAITVDGETRHLDAEDLTIVRRASGELVVKEALGRFAAIDPAITPELRLEGLAREFVSRVQRSRKDAALAVSDRIRLAVHGSQELTQAVAEYKNWIAGEVLAVEIVIGEGDNGLDHFPISQTADIDGFSVRFALTTEI